MGVKTVLVIEDDEDLVYLITILLEEQGYRVITASNGREALDELRRAVPDLILLDMKMPVMSGPEFARELYAQHPERALVAAAAPRLHYMQGGMVTVAERQLRRARLETLEVLAGPEAHQALPARAAHAAAVEDRLARDAEAGQHLGREIRHAA